MSQQKPFINGQEIQYKINDGWRDGWYVGKLRNNDLHVIVNKSNMLYERLPHHIRHPKVKKEGWVNVYPNAIGGVIHLTKELAMSGQGSNAIDTVRIEWEE